MRIRLCLVIVWNLIAAALMVWLCWLIGPKVIAQFSVERRADGTLHPWVIAAGLEGAGYMIGWLAVLLSLMTFMAGRVGMARRCGLAALVVVAAALLLSARALQDRENIRVGLADDIIFLGILLLATGPAVATGRGLAGWIGVVAVRLLPRRLHTSGT